MSVDKSMYPHDHIYIIEISNYKSTTCMKWNSEVNLWTLTRNLIVVGKRQFWEQCVF